MLRTKVLINSRLFPYLFFFPHHQPYRLRRSWDLGRKLWLGPPRSRGSRRSSWGGESRSWPRGRSTLWSESWTSSSIRCTRRNPAWKRGKATSRRADCWSWAGTATASVCPLVGTGVELRDFFLNRWVRCPQTGRAPSLVHPFPVTEHFVFYWKFRAQEVQCWQCWSCQRTSWNSLDLGVWKGWHVIQYGVTDLKCCT